MPRRQSKAPISTADLLAVGLALVTAWVVLGIAAWPLAAAMLVAVGTHRRLLLRDPTSGRFGRLYLLALAWQVLHVAEELAGGFAERWPLLLGTEPWSAGCFVVFNVSAYVIFLAAGIAAQRGRRFGTVFASFFVLASLGTAVGHLALAIYLGGYFPGTLTAPGSILFAVLVARASNARALKS